MDNLRQWEITTPLTLAADSRLALTDYTDDQVWELACGKPNEPALRLQTQYGGRVALASLVPMWTINAGNIIHETQDYAESPKIIAFAPNFARAVANITHDITLIADYWVMSSHAVGARFTLTNTSVTSISLRVDLFGHVIEHKNPRSLAIISLSNDTVALNMGYVGNSRPVVVMENADTDLSPTRDKASPKIGVTLTLEPGESQAVRWVHAGLETLEESFERGRLWLNHDWETAFADIDLASSMIPKIRTNDDTLDTAIAHSYQQLVQAFLSPTKHAHHAPFVATRHKDKGFSKQGTGTDYGRGWNGDNFKLSYLAATAIAPLDAKLAQGILLDYLDTQTDKGFIDLQNGPAGQQSKLLCTPILARLAWMIYEYTEDQAFLKAIFPKVLQFFHRWFKSDHDTEFDGAPEWRDERQTGYSGFPSFANSTWAQGIHIKYFETPDLVAYLLSEAHYLKKIGQVIGDEIAAMGASQRIRDLREMLDQMWLEDGQRYAYRERDTDAIGGSTIIIEEGRGDEEHIPSLELTPPSRLIVRVNGGTNRAPNTVIHIEGLDRHGKQVEETAEAEELLWTYGSGTYATRRIFSRVDRIRCTRLSRVYHIHVSTMDTTRIDINAILPIFSGDIQVERAEALTKLIDADTHFSRPNGLTIVSAQDPDYDPSSAKGGGGIWTYWLTLVSEGLLNYEQGTLAGNLLKRLMQAQAQHFTQTNTFHEFYHCDIPKGLGETGHLEGIVPLHLLLKIVGVRIISTGRVWTGGDFHWQTPITITQFGVTVTRTAENTAIKFPSGYEVELAKDAEWQVVIDPNPVPMPDLSKLISLDSTPASADKRVIIEVEHQDDLDKPQD